MFDTCVCAPWSSIEVYTSLRDAVERHGKARVFKHQRAKRLV